MMKKCGTCKIEKDETEFHFKNKSKNLRKVECKSCYLKWKKRPLNILPKICTTCNIEKEAIAFSKNSSWCKECVAVYNKKYRQINEERLNKKSKEYRNTHKEQQKEYQKEYTIINKEQLSEYQKEYRIINADKLKESNKEYRKLHQTKIKKVKQKYYEENKEIILDKCNQYYESNKEKIILRVIEYKKNRCENDLAFKLGYYVSTSIRNILRSNFSPKGGKSIKQYLPYTFEELKLHLESQFEPWMTWDNWGVYNSKTWDDNDQSTWKWQLDHIKPHSEFHYKTMDCQEFRDCWTLSNLRPLNAKQNLLDGTTRIRHNQVDKESEIDK